MMDMGLELIPARAIVELDESLQDLCRACQTLFIDIDLSACVEDRFQTESCRRHKDDVPGQATDRVPRTHVQINQSRDGGCEICGIVANLRTDPESPTVLFRLSQYEKLRTFGVGIWRLMNWDYFEGEDPSYSPVGRIFVYRVVHRFVRVRSFNLMKAWLRNCVTSHNVCGGVPSSSWLPTRLVDVRDLSRPRLVLSKDIPIEEQAPSYMTLSHRWTDSVVRLTTSNTFEFQNCLPTARLSQTFLDAFTVTHRLGVRYIWIDSLCILQDSDNDWKSESAQMGRIYQDGFCNISATAASSGQELNGLWLKDREPTWRSSATFRIPIQKRYKPTLSKRALFRASLGLPARWLAEVERSPLNSRGWVLQERFLSPRTIHFASSEMFWECRTKCISDGTRGLADSVYPELPCFKLMGLSSRKVSVSWSKFTEEYCQRFLTKGSDRLMALAGVAKAVNSFTRFGDSTHPSAETLPNRDIAFTGKYLAGLWEVGLPRNLGWVVERRVLPATCSRADEYRAPTWSWTSLDFQSALVRHPGYYNGIFFTVVVVQVLDAQVFPRNGFDEFGPLIDGRIILAARTYPLNLAEFVRPAIPETATSRDLPFQLYLDTYPAPENLETVADVCLPICAADDGLEKTFECLLLKRDERLHQETGAEPRIRFVRVGVIFVSLEWIWDSDPRWRSWTKRTVSTPQALREVVALGRLALSTLRADMTLALPRPEETTAIY